MLGPVASATTIKLPESTLWTIWTSADQLHNYYFNMYLRSGENGMMGRTLLEIIPYSLLVFPKEMRVNGEVITTVEAYRLDKLELIGLAMHDQPTAYSVNRHPLFMLEQTSPNEPPKPGAIKGDVPLTVTTPRPLTDAEKTALTEIKTGKDVIEQPGAEGALRIVGALRAQAGCIQCHTTNKVGDVLGAFSYRLSKVPLFGN